MKTLHYVLIVCGLLLVAACTGKPLYNVESAPLNAPETASLDDIQRGIIRAGAMRGWQMTPIEPGYVQGTLNRRSHTAVIDVRFDEDSYSILYKDSTNLNYDGESIHGAYNQWIQYLQTDINAQMAALY
ncbi:MAG: hypothetical protein HC826_00770 [Rhodospirillales bacterium]|nr:hypothetical protein [Rhodospirillales bacterium]